MGLKHIRLDMLQKATADYKETFSHCEYDVSMELNSTDCPVWLGAPPDVKTAYLQAPINCKVMWYITTILERIEMSDCKGRSAPCEQKPDFDGDAKPADSKKYREIVSKLSQYLSDPKEQHWITTKHVLRCLKGTMKHGLCYKKRQEKASNFEWGRV